MLAAELDQGQARHLDREVAEEVAGAQQRVEHGDIVLRRQRLHDEPDPLRFRLDAAVFFGCDDGDGSGIARDMAKKQR